MVARCDAAFFGLLCPLEVGVFSVVFTPTFLAGRVWRRVWGRCRSKVGEEIAINTPTFSASDARGPKEIAALPAHSGVSASVGFPAVHGAGLR